MTLVDIGTIDDLDELPALANPWRAEAEGVTFRLHHFQHIYVGKAVFIGQRSADVTLGYIQ